MFSSRTLKVASGRERDENGHSVGGLGSGVFDLWACMCQKTVARQISFLIHRVDCTAMHPRLVDCAAMHPRLVDCAAMHPRLVDCFATHSRLVECDPKGTPSFALIVLIVHLLKMNSSPSAKCFID